MNINESMKHNVLAETIYFCIKNPGNVSTKIFRTDGISHCILIEQLFANYYRTEKYTYLIAPTYRDNLNSLNEHYKNTKSFVEDHMNKFHKENLNFPEEGLKTNCNEMCILYHMNTIHEVIKEYGKNILIELSNKEKVANKILDIAENYVVFMIIMESCLPYLSELIRKIPSTKYPFSLWKYLYNLFLDYVISPLEPQLIEILVEGISKIRHNAAFSTISTFESFLIIPKLKAINELLNAKYIDELSVHVLESNQYQFGTNFQFLMQKLINQQTKKLYEEFNTVNSLTSLSDMISKDISILEKMLIPIQTKSILDNCVIIGREMGNLNERELEKLFNKYIGKNAEFRRYLKQIGLKKIINENSIAAV